MDWLDFDSLPNLLSTAMGSQVTQFGIAFAIAAFIHAGRMKKEIASQMSQVVGAVNNLAQALRQDLSSQSDRISKVELDVATIKGTITREK